MYLVPKHIRGMIRKAAEAQLSQMCLISYQGETLDEAGRPVTSWLTVAEDVPCRLIKAGTQSASAVKEVAAQIAEVERYKLIVAQDQVLDVDYRVTVEGEDYYVVSLDLTLTDRGFRSAILQKTRGAN